jgi:hypothetical protein
MLSLSDPAGKEIWKTIFSLSKESPSIIPLDISSLATGSYYISLSSEGNITTRRIEVFH